MKASIAFGGAAALILLSACDGGHDSADRDVTAQDSAEPDNAAQLLDTPEDVVMAPDESAMGNGLPVAEDVNDVAPATAPANAQ
ncbi:MAG TPA: hypothetical protein VGR19_02195 [Allosphingosinicella sp.]|nr:hypothetical protein [Allosphingosinicella sp.]